MLNRLGFGARPGDVDRVREIGLAIDTSTSSFTPSASPTRRWRRGSAGFETLTLNSRTIAEDYYVPAQMARRKAQLASKNGAASTAMPRPTPASSRGRRKQMEMARKQREVLVELSEQKILRAAYSDRQLEEVMTDFWFNHFNVFAGKGPTQDYLTAYERDAIRPHVLGKFRDLLGATAKSPAMLFYLDNWQSVDPQAADRLAAQRAMRTRARGTVRLRDAAARRTPTRKQPQQQRRGLNENYGRELMELHTLGVDGGYTQQDVVNVARAFTGWTIEQPRQGGGFRFEPRFHDDREKIVLGHKIKAGGGESDGEQVLDILAKHPSTARFIATKLARRFVVRHAAAGARRSRRGDVPRDRRRHPRGGAHDRHVAGVLRRRGLPREGEDAVRVRRLGGARDRRRRHSTRTPLVQAVRQLGMPLYMCQPPTGYADRADAWVNTGALLNRMNFALQLVSGRMRAVAAGRRLGERRARRRPLRDDRRDDRQGVRPETGRGAHARLAGIPEEIAMFSRRIFLKNGGLALLSLGFAPAFLARTVEAAGNARRKVLITIFQRGAVDGLNMVVPFGEQDYYAARPSIAMPRPNAADGAVDLDGFFGLHPRLGALKPLWDSRQLAIVHASGSPDGTRSHFDAQDYMESGTPGVKSTQDGWLNRYPARARARGRRRRSAPWRSRRSCRARCRASSRRWRSTRSASSASAPARRPTWCRPRSNRSTRRPPTTCSTAPAARRSTR